jgi:lipid-A-disaccharide synthase
LLLHGFINPGKTLKLYIIAGEASGDLHGSNLIRALRASQADVSIRAWGGDLMQAQGATLVKHYRDLAFMGFVEVLLNLRTILRNMAFCKKDILQYRPDAIVLIDYPGFNLRIAEWSHQRGIRVFYYISPQIWAWKENRIHNIKKNVDHMFVVLPFEQEFYARHHYSVTFTGHPLLDVISAREKNDIKFRSENKLDSRPIIALLPGSRKQEISTMLPVMLEVAHNFKDYQFVVAAAPGQDLSFYEPFTQNTNTPVIGGKTYDLLLHARAGIVTSGTATLETGLFSLPQVVCYKGNKISYLIARKLIKIKFISLVNLILNREAVKELIQDEMNANSISLELNSLLFDEKRITKMKNDYTEMHRMLGGPGASQRTANAMLKILSTEK